MSSESLPSSSSPASARPSWTDRLKTMSQAQLLQVVLNLASHASENEVSAAINSVTEEDPSLKDNSTRKVFVRQISFDTTTETLRACFEPYGDIEEAAVVFDKISGKSKGYGFVTFTNPEAAARALVEPIKTIDNRNTESCLASLGKEDMIRRKHTSVAAEDSPRQRKQQNTPNKPAKKKAEDHPEPAGHPIPNYAQHVMMMHDSPRVRGRDHYTGVQGAASGPSSTSTSAVNSPRPYASAHHSQYGHFESGTSSLNSSRSSTPTPAGQHTFSVPTSSPQPLHSKGLAASHVQNFAYSQQQTYTNPYLQTHNMTHHSHAAPHHVHPGQSVPPPIQHQHQPVQQPIQPSQQQPQQSDSYSPSYYSSPRQSYSPQMPSQASAESDALRILNSHPELSALLAQIVLNDERPPQQQQHQPQYAQHHAHGQYQDAPLPLSPTIHGKFSYDFPPPHQQ